MMGGAQRGPVLCAVMLAASTRAGLAEQIVIETDRGNQAFQVEIAVTPEQRRIGLMHRKALPQNAGMLFDYGTASPATMWMKNTLIPLDMLFIRDDGRISSIAHHTTPLSLEHISSTEPVRAVLEINGGVARQLDIHAGHRVRHRIFDNVDSPMGTAKNRSGARAVDF